MQTMNGHEDSTDNSNSTEEIKKEETKQSNSEPISSVTYTQHSNTAYSQIPETKTFHPTLQQFTNPLQYIQSIRDEGLKYGIIKIKPPKEWKPSFNLSFDDFKFSTKVQPIHILEKRVPNGSLSSFTLTQLRSNFLKNLRIFLGDQSIDDIIINKKKVYLYDLYKKVTLYGGYHKITNDKMWKNVGTELGVEFIGNTMTAASYIAKLCYELYLLQYEQSFYFPSICTDITMCAKDKYSNILVEKAAQIRKIKPANNAGINDINTAHRTCSVCGQFQRSNNLIFECYVCGNRFHSHCHEPNIMTVDQQRFCCSGCKIQKTAKFGYDSSNQTYSLNEYQTRAKQCRDNVLASLGRNSGMTPTEWENIFWSIVDNGCFPVSVEYGSEVPSKREMTGFPMENSTDMQSGINYASHEFNLMNIKNATGNILKHLERNISGMTYPWIYVGMLFTAFGWHYEDHYSYSANYNHFGAAKQWYGIPALSAGSAEQAMRELNNGVFEQFDLVTLVSPLVLFEKYKIPIYKARQKAGEFVITFPQAYHAGFNTGFNVAEAVNFCTSDWLSFGLKCSERYRVFGRRQAFAHDELVCNLCSKVDTLDVPTLKWLFESFVISYKAHYEFIQKMLAANVTRGRMWEYDVTQWVKYSDKIANVPDGTGRMKYDDTKLNEVKYEDAECVKCNNCLYIACVRCQCDPSVVTCHKHFNEYCACDVSDKWFEFRFSLTWFEAILQKLISKVGAVYRDNEYNKLELFSDISDKNYEILTKSSDVDVLDIACNHTTQEMRHTFHEKFESILGGYANELVTKLRERFPRLHSQPMTQEELEHLCHACECVVWAHFNDEQTNDNLKEVRQYFEILCDYSNCTKILLDTYKNYSNVQSFYTQLQQLQGQYDKIAILLQNQPRFPKKLSLNKVEIALQRAANGEIKVELDQIISQMPSIIAFMSQQQEILQNALNGILSTTWTNKHSLIIQARTIVNFIPGNFADSYWRYLANNDILNTSTNTIGRDTCLVLPILEWLLSEFERGILASIDCDAMNTIKEVIRKGNAVQTQIEKYFKNSNKDCWLTQSEISDIIDTCNNMHLRVPFWEFMQQRYTAYNTWNEQSLAVLQRTTKKCSYEMIKNLVKQYNEYRIFNKNGDILKGYVRPIRRWISAAKSELNGSANVQTCHTLVVQFDEWVEIITAPPKEYELLLECIGINAWMGQVSGQLKNDNVRELKAFIETGLTFNIQACIGKMAALNDRLGKLEAFYAECAQMCVCIENKGKSCDLSAYKAVMLLANDMSIDINGNQYLSVIMECIRKIEEWEAYLKDKMAHLFVKNVNECKTYTQNHKKRKYSEISTREESRYVNGGYKRRKKNNSKSNHNGNTNGQCEVELEKFWWNEAIHKQKSEFALDTSMDYTHIRQQRQNESEIVQSLQEMVDKSVDIPCHCELENRAKSMLNNVKECIEKCEELIKSESVNECDIITVKDHVSQVLNGTKIEFEISQLHWQWNAVRYLQGLKEKSNGKYWGIYRLFYEGRMIGLNGSKEWIEIEKIYKDLVLFDNVCNDLFVHGNMDCKVLLSFDETIKNTNVIDIVKHCIIDKESEYKESLDKTVAQIHQISDRIRIFCNFYDSHFKKGILTFENLEILSKEMNLLSECLNGESIPNSRKIASTLTHMTDIFSKLETLYSDRPHKDKCGLIEWINFTFMQFNIMYRNTGIIQMDKYRLNTVNHCYCFCRFVYTSKMKENNEKIPEMIGCEECAEWFHSDCIMLDDKTMRKYFNSKRNKFVCPRCCYYEYNDGYKNFPSLHWQQMKLAKLTELEQLTQSSDIASNAEIILCESEMISGVHRLISWIKLWQKDVNTFVDCLCRTHNVLSDFNEEEVFICEYLLNCGQISGVFTLELVILKILLRFIGKSTVYNNNGVRQLGLYEVPMQCLTEDLLAKYENKSKLLCDFISSTVNDIKECKQIFCDCFVDLYFIKSVGIHYITYMRRKKKGPMKVKMTLHRLNEVMTLELNECQKILNNKAELEAKGEAFVDEQFTNEDTEWLKYVNESVSLRKTDKAQCRTKWIEKLNVYKSSLMKKYKNSRLRIQSIVLTADLVEKMIEG